MGVVGALGGSYGGAAAYVWWLADPVTAVEHAPGGTPNDKHYDGDGNVRCY